MRYALLILVAIMGTGCFPQTPQELVSKATEAMSQGKSQKATELLTEAAESNYKPAIELFVSWYDNDLLEWEIKNYHYWLEKSAEFGNIKSMSRLAEANRKIGNESEHLKWLTMASEAGSTMDTIYLSDHHLKRLAESPKSPEYKHWAGKLFNATNELKEDIPPSQTALAGIKLIFSEDSKLMAQGYRLLGYLLLNDDLIFELNNRKLQITKSGKTYATPTIDSLIFTGRDGDIKAAVYYVLALIKAKNQLLQKEAVNYEEVGQVMVAYSTYLDFINSKTAQGNNQNFNETFQNFRAYVAGNCLDWKSQCAAVTQYAHLYK